jgi:hypothetical protein
MKKTLRFCFRINEKVGMAEDKNGNPSEAFICAKAKGAPIYNIPKEKYQDMQEAYRKLLASQLECDIEMLEPITLNEYLDETEEEE